MIKLELTANSVAELNSQMLNLLGVNTMCDECRAESEEEDYEEEPCGCGCHHEEDEEEYLTDCEKVMRELETKEKPSHFSYWLRHTRFFNIAKPVTAAYNDYWNMNSFTKANEEVLSLSQFTELLRQGGLKIMFVAGEDHIIPSN